jgi:hypothetical protein
MDELFPQWLIDFAALYNITGEALPLLLPIAASGGNELMRDLYLHKKYVEEDHPLSVDDIDLLFGGDPNAGVSFRSHLPVETLPAALNAVEKYLRERTGKNFFTFFYPSAVEPVTIYGFKDLYNAGYSVYTAEWIPFCAHPPLIAFLKDLVDYLSFRQEADSDTTAFKRKGPSLEERWRIIIDAALGFGPVGEPPRKPIELEAETLAQLRGESDQVRELLRPIEADQPAAGTAADETAIDETGVAEPETANSTGKTKPETPALPLPPVSQADKSLKAFLAELGEVETEAIKFIAAADPGNGTALGKQLDELARKHRTMPELIFDGINGRFLELFKDLLIDTAGEEPVIQAEYMEEVRKLLGLESPL